MPPIRNRTRVNRQSYYDSLPENWSVKKLRDELRLKGITQPQNTRHSVLVSLYKQTVTTNEETRTALESRRQETVTPNQDVRTELLGVVKDLTSTVQSLQSSMISLTERVNTMSRPQTSIPAAAGSAEQLRQSGAQTTTSRNDSTPVISGTPRETRETENYTLTTAWADQTSPKPMGVRTTYGYSAESLPYVETISPNLRKQIIEDGQISKTSSRGGQTSHNLSSIPHDDYVEEIKTLWDAAVSQQTARAYSTGIQHLLTFVTLCGIAVPVGTLSDLSEDVLIKFVSYCHYSLSLTFSNIKLYLAGIRFHYLKAGHSNPFKEHDRLDCILRGIKRLQSNVSKPKRFPVTYQILCQMVNRLNGSIFSPFIDFMLSCCSLMAFFGFLRCGEFTVKSRNVDNDFLRMRDVIVQRDKLSYILCLKYSKTDPFRQGVFIHVFNNEHTKPVNIMHEYCQLRISQGAEPNSPLFVDSDGSPLSRNQFISYIRHVMAVLGYDDAKYCGHSFRIGAATSAAEAGIENHLIQTLGRWSSNCYMYVRYIRTDEKVLKEAQEKMCNVKRS
ncbi:uncharacterized protein LOC133179252 [Saccostrea echinata]|uniref:uncharacterized protein LOC133179252 n=1 Tax=Saccostrea echinata TaxID=191078 RepID=UPI002A80F178|nr:uncharacterized protein LOC133179252 [Saccostrea echinata]